ncbi:MAG: hypothetical protein PHF37_01130 [Phycisphaerae bacterium]|nr:hypothetical protein [Phycisphaerae bacterium]
MAKKKKLVIGRWNKDEIKYLKKVFKNTTTSDVAAVLNRKPQAVTSKAFQLMLKKSKKHLKNIGLAK